MAEDNNLSEEINQAYINIVGEEYADADQAEEAYAGEYGSDKDFARELAEECGELDANPSWPYTCINWEQASREIMYDYSDDSGYYFRNL